jgi:hypothetical protein
MPDNVPEETGITLADDNLFSGLPSEVLAELTPAKNRMILLYITGQYKIPRIADIVGVSENTVRAWLMQPKVQQVIKELQTREFEIIDSSLKALRMKAIGTMNELMDSPMDAVRFQASKDILDRTGHKAVNEIKVDKTVRNIEQQLKDIAEFTIDEADVIDITDVVEQVKAGYGNTDE